MSVALGRLFDTGDLDDCRAALKQLHDGMDRRLAEALGLALNK
jgi:hypothetical protein